MATVLPHNSGKGGTIRKVMGGGGGKQFLQRKMSGKKFVQRRWQRTNKNHAEGNVLLRSVFNI